MKSISWSAAWCDDTSEFLTAKLRAGNAGSNTAADNIEVLTEAVAQVPGTHRKKLLVRGDGTGVSHGLFARLAGEPAEVRGRSVESSVGFASTEKIRDAIALVRKIWTPAIDADGGIREGGDVAELTGLLDPVVDRVPRGGGL